MEVLEVGHKIFKFADKHNNNIKEMMSMSDFGSDLTDLMVMSHETMMMTTYWQLAAGLTKEMTEPLKSIVNK